MRGSDILVRAMHTPFRNGDVESYLAAPAGSLPFQAQSAGMLKPLTANSLDARLPRKESSFCGRNSGPKCHEYCALELAPDASHVARAPSPAKIISHATGPRSSPYSHPHANGLPDPLPADNSFRLNCSCGTAPQNPSVVEIAQTATRPQTQHRFAMAPKAKLRSRTLADMRRS